MLQDKKRWALLHHHNRRCVIHLPRNHSSVNNPPPHIKSYITVYHLKHKWGTARVVVFNSPFSLSLGLLLRLHFEAWPWLDLRMKTIEERKVVNELKSSSTDCLHVMVPLPPPLFRFWSNPAEWIHSVTFVSFSHPTPLCVLHVVALSPVQLHTTGTVC